MSERKPCGTGMVPPTANVAEPKPSAATQRMRLYRHRRCRGLRSVRILLNATEIDSLVRKGYLEDQRRNDQTAIEAAAEYCFTDALFEPVTRNELHFLPN